MTLNLFGQSAFDGVWTGKLAAGGNTLTMVLNVSSDENGISCTMDSPDQGVKGIQAEASVENAFLLVVKVPAVGAQFKGMLVGNSLVGTFTQMGKEFPLSFKKGAELLSRPQTPQGPFPYSEEEVVFTNVEAGATLAGTLLVPQDATPDTPVVLMITGSGLENRDEEVFDHKPFLVIADYLARNGIASLRYDDRCFGKSRGGEVKNATTLDFQQDAAAGVAFLRSRGGSSAQGFGKIGALGHSEGANIALMLGAKGEVDFVISLAAVGVKGDEAFCAQANKVLELQGIPQRMTVPQYRANALSQGSKWVAWFLDYNPIPDIQACECPVFAVNGDKDIQVISSLNLSSIQNNLPRNPSNFVKEYPSLNHLFQHCTTGNVTEYRSIEESFSEEVLKDLVLWIQKNVGIGN